jgi:predicted metal-dependent HD superfamily phosphohydrolase
LIADIDLAILGANRARFGRYETDIRKEFAAVPESEYRAGRREVLQAFLDRPRLYQTDYFYGLLEARARENIRVSLVKLGE